MHTYMLTVYMYTHIHILYTYYIHACMHTHINTAYMAICIHIQIRTYHHTCASKMHIPPYNHCLGSHAMRLYGWLAFTLVSGSQDAVMLYMVRN